MSKPKFYHAGCPVCIGAEQELLQLLGPDKVEVIHLGEQKSRVDDAERLGVKSVPALVTDNGSVLHINFGAALADLR